MAICVKFESRLRSKMLKFILEKGTGSSQEQNVHKLYFSPQNQTKNPQTLIMENFSPGILAGVIKRTCNSDEQAVLIGDRSVNPYSMT